MASKTKYKPSDFICKECGNVYTLQRITAKQFPKYNERTIWCIKCKKTTLHLEVQNIDLLLTEMTSEEESVLPEKIVAQLTKKRKG